MNWKISLVILTFGLLACKKGQVTDNQTPVSSPYLLSAKELKEMSLQPSTKIVDFRTKEKYVAGHIIGALTMQRSDIEDSSYPYNGRMASPSQIEALFSNLGIKTEDTLVIYDDIGLCNASRLWWILQNYSFKNVKMLQGGLSAWEAIAGEITTATPEIQKSTFRLEKPLMNYFVTKEAVLKAIENHTLILDTRTRDEYSGKEQKTGAAKAGRIPTSVHIDWADAIDYNGDKSFKSIQDLEAIYSKLHATKEDPIIVYCHSGVRSAHTFFVLTQLLGYKNVRNYDGSWTEWSHIDSHPFENDNLTIINK
jgi:thiosulfate/3-mercaptopyruvate sulfurtransferase